MSTAFLPREAFADEQSYIAHRRHVAALRRAERLNNTNKQPRMQHPPRIAKLLKLMRGREYKKRSYWRDPERSRERISANRRRNYWNNPDLYRRLRRESHARRREDERLYCAAYNREHREERRALCRAIRERHKQETIEYGNTPLDTRSFEAEVYRLRQQGLTWVRIGIMLARTDSACSYAYKRYLERPAKPYKDNIRAHLTPAEHAERRLQLGRRVAALRAEGRIWPEIEELTGTTRATCVDACTRWLQLQGKLNYDPWQEFQNRVVELLHSGHTWAEIGELTGRTWKTCVSAYRFWKKRQQQHDMEASA